MANEKPTSTRTIPQTTPTEMTALAKRLRARADSVLYKDQPSQAGDMRAAAGLLEQFAQLRGDIERLANEMADDIERQHLRDLLGGQS
jgi:hypothetical protein